MCHKNDGYWIDQKASSTFEFNDTPPPPPIHEYYEDIEEITWDKTVNLFLEEFRLEQWDMSLDYMINSHEKFLRAIKGALVFI